MSELADYLAGKILDLDRMANEARDANPERPYTYWIGFLEGQSQACENIIKDFLKLDIEEAKRTHMINYLVKRKIEKESH